MPSARRALAPVAAFLVALALLVLFLTRQPLLYDNDSYYHLAVARTFAAEGPVDRLDAVRSSAMSEGFGDKEVLFHLLLAPFAARPDFVLGGQIFLGLMLAAIFATLGALASRVLGLWGYALPYLLVFTSTEVAWRLVRLRPELWSLELLLLALAAIGARRFRWLAPIGAAYALGYTAFHAFLGLCGALFLFVGWTRRRWHLPLLLYPGLGVGIGLVLHPHFPHNLTIWVLQSLDFFQSKAMLDVGTEIRPNTTDVTLMVNLGLFLIGVAVWRAGVSAVRKAGDSRLGDGLARDDADDRGFADASGFADAFGVAAVLFGVLYLLMSRFSLYFFPFAALWLPFELARRGRRIGSRVRWFGGRTVPLALVLPLCLLVATPEALRQLANYRERNAPGPERARLRDREQLAAALPAGARVAAPWQQTPIYMLWAPHARYLNVLDPIFMARPYPEAYAVQARIFAGNEPDVPLRLVTGLDSDWIAYSRATPTGDLTERLVHDPRVRLRHGGSNVLFQILPGRNQDFVLDWQVTSISETPATTAVHSPRSYPRHPTPEGRAVEGFVDLERVAASGCVTLEHEESGPADFDLELAAAGVVTLSISGEVRVQITQRGALLGAGAKIPVALRAGPQPMSVTACRDGEGPFGFYLLRRNRAD